MRSAKKIKPNNDCEVLFVANILGLLPYGNTNKGAAGALCQCQVQDAHHLPQGCKNVETRPAHTYVETEITQQTLWKKCNDDIPDNFCRILTMVCWY
jgi:hypothetical protein